MQKKITLQKADFDLAEALNRGSDDELESRSDIRSMRSETLSEKIFKEKNAREGRFRPNDTVSEVCDPVERDALFEHSFSKGLFSNIKHSPLRERAP